MGESFVAVNPIKRQFVHPGSFGGDNRLGDLFHGACGGCLELLMTDSKAFESVRPIPNDSPMRLIGLWLGDPVVIAGDDYGMPNPFGFRTTTKAEPERNLWRMAHDEFQDISYHALATLCVCRHLELLDLAERAQTNKTVLFSLGVVATIFERYNVAQALDEFDDRGWRERFNAMLHESGEPWKAQSPQPLAEFLRAMKRD